MKSKFLMVLLTVVLISCQTMTDNEPSKIENPFNQDEKIKKILTDKFEVIIYDGFEYLIYKKRS